MSDVPAFRYVNGRLVSCDSFGAVMRLQTMPAFDARAWRMIEGSERARSAGIFAHDRGREAALPGGPPVWFKPNAARRARWLMWSTTPASRRAAIAPASLYDEVNVETLTGHRFRTERTNDRREVIARTEALLYLPEGEPVTAQHGRDLDHAMRTRGVPEPKVSTFDVGSEHYARTGRVLTLYTCPRCGHTQGAEARASIASGLPRELRDVAAWKQEAQAKVDGNETDRIRTMARRTYDRHVCGTAREHT